MSNNSPFLQWRKGPQKRTVTPSLLHTKLMDRIESSNCSPTGCKVTRCVGFIYVRELERRSHKY